ncbi:heterokaryon incompatibility protein-domain-containing protein [Dactylonectria macrodidyma]|uniref:Heterokaryon incompatibility protein-domain-containing protein n=1 Tax=Dactylonectria macrodidyma TaxID=307937 RepID=A0A9P9E1B1_9HYPO|nr:heterokaryon incompatibility protein-domain-containing protein [Dactylonectria macrodidyma]
MANSLYSDLQNDEFRLLKAFYDQNRVLSCNMTAFNLDSHPAYTALSYAWGKELFAVPISCNGETINISRSLLSAFEAFVECPSLQTPEWVWADFLCINQKDEAEKAVQIRVMDQIYKKAEIVTIWSGTGDVKTQESLRTLENFGCMIARSPPIHSMDYVMSLSGDPQWTELEPFFRREWFTRSWVVQEVLLAQKARLVCGTTSIDWNKVIDLYLGCLEESQSNKVMLIRHELGYNVLRSLYDLSRKLGSSYYDLELLNLIRQRVCKEPVDKVYSILGLINPEVRAKIVIDYKIDPWSIFIRLAQELLKHHGPDVFILAPSVERPPELPSWVPNLLSSPLMTHAWYKHTASKLEEATGVDPEYKIPDKAALLTVDAPGICMAIIGNVYPLPDLSDGIITEHHARELLEAVKFCRTIWAQRNQKFKLKENVLTLIGGVVSRREGLERPIMDEFNEMIRNLKGFLNGDMFNTPNAHFMQSMMDAWKGACLFTTEDNHVGLGPKTMQRGDKVWIFFKASTPFVLRGNKDRVTHQLLGPAYIHTFMDGTAFEAKNPRETYEILTIQ